MCPLKVIFRAPHQQRRYYRPYTALVCSRQRSRPHVEARGPCHVTCSRATFDAAISFCPYDSSLANNSWSRFSLRRQDAPHRRISQHDNICRPTLSPPLRYRSKQPSFLRDSNRTLASLFKSIYHTPSSPYIRPLALQSKDTFPSSSPTRRIERTRIHAPSHPSTTPLERDLQFHYVIPRPLRTDYTPSNHVVLADSHFRHVLLPKIPWGDLHVVRIICLVAASCTCSYFTPHPISFYF